MSDISPSGQQSEPERFSIDELGERITGLMDGLAQIPDEARITKQLLAVWTAHLNQAGRADVPQRVVQQELLQAAMDLELRMIRVEKSLERAGIELPPMP